MRIKCWVHKLLVVLCTVNCLLEVYGVLLNSSLLFTTVYSGAHYICRTVHKCFWYTECLDSYVVSARCTEYNVPCTVYWVQCTIPCTMYWVHVPMYTVLSTINPIHCIMYNVKCTVYWVQYTVNSVQCTVYNVLSTIYRVQFTDAGSACRLRDLLVVLWLQQ